MSHHSANPPAWGPVLARAVAIWFPIAAAATGLALLVYGAAQQGLRQQADDPQVALAENAAARLDAGVGPASVAGAERVELERSLDPFVLVFDPSGQLLAASATLHGQPPDYPGGVFGTVRARGQDHVTWQPEPGVRSATVAVAWQGGFVVAGRSLRLTEQHEDLIGMIVAFGWLVTMALVAGAALLVAAVYPPSGGPALALGSWAGPSRPRAPDPGAGSREPLPGRAGRLFQR